MKVITDHYGIENVNSNAIAMVLLAFILLVNLTGVKAIKKVQIPIDGCHGHGRGIVHHGLVLPDLDLGRLVENFQPVSLSMGTAAALVFVAFSGAIKVGAIGERLLTRNKSSSRHDSIPLHRHPSLRRQWRTSWPP